MAYAIHINTIENSHTDINKTSRLYTRCLCIVGSKTCAGIEQR